MSAQYEPFSGAITHAVGRGRHRPGVRPVQLPSMRGAESGAARSHRGEEGEVAASCAGEVAISLSSP